ncbi:hypothetical protein L1049_017289 [Liquidambar formosana]|uniref:SWIM-type domain-containing protein n=1 Tax=Liquidambar formosana TaxID=63359 RepID=A0AAP0S2V9_LIQFO
MAPKLVVICRIGGKLVDKESREIYVGGEAHAFELDEEMEFSLFLSRVATSCNVQDTSTISLKYLVPGNSSVMISLGSDDDLACFARVFHSLISAELYILQHDVRFVGTRATTSQFHAVNESINELNVEVLEPRLISSWRDVITEVGQTFEGVVEFRKAIGKYAIARHFAYKYNKNDPDRVTAICKEEGCEWRIHASRLKDTKVFRLQTFTSEHSCDPGIRQKTHPQATKKLVGSLVQDKLRDTPKYSAREIINDIRRDFEISLGYLQAYRGKDIAQKAIHGSMEDSFNKIPWLCSKIMETNPGSYVEWLTGEDCRFQRLFISFYAQILGFKKACRPLLMIDGTFGKDHYKTTILSAIAIDGNDQMFPFAFGVVLGETKRNWLWFLMNLRTILDGVVNLTIISDRHVGLVDSVTEVFPECYHAFCVRHIVANLLGSLGSSIKSEAKKVIKGLVYVAVGSTRIEAFNHNLNEIKSISKEAYAWVRDSEPFRWAKVYATGNRYGHLTTNVAESFNSWILEARNLPIIPMVNKIREQLMGHFYTRREEASRWTKSLTPSFDEILQKYVLQSLICRVSPSNNSLYEVDDGVRRRLVNLQTMTCTCRMWKMTKIACIHVAKVCKVSRRNIVEYCSPYYTTEMWRLAYAESIHPVPNEDMPFNIGTLSSKVAIMEGDLQNISSNSTPVLPPKTRPRPGRPKKRRLESQPEPKRALHCGRCGSIGHNRATCNKAI